MRRESETPTPTPRPRYKARIITRRARYYAESDHLGDTIAAVIAALAKAHRISEARARAWTEGRDERLNERHGAADLAWIDQK